MEILNFVKNEQRKELGSGTYRDVKFGTPRKRSEETFDRKLIDLNGAEEKSEDEQSDGAKLSTHRVVRAGSGENVKGTTVL